MHVSIRTFTRLWGLADRLIASIRTDLVPGLARASGFLGHCTLACEQDRIVLVTIVRDTASAVQADAEMGGWMRANLGDMPVSRPDIIEGETLLHEYTSIQRDDVPAMFGVVRIYDGIGPREELLPLVRQHVFLTITGAAGFRGYYAFLDKDNATRGVAVSLFDNRAHAMEANERVVSVMRDRHIAPNPPMVMAGPTVAVAAR